MSKKLVKSTNNKIIFGVCAGIADQFNIDPTIVRLIWGIAFFIYSSGFLIYILCALILPKGQTNN